MSKNMIKEMPNGRSDARISYQIHRRSDYRNIALFVNSDILKRMNYSRWCNYYRVPHQVKVSIVKYLRFQKKVRIEETPTSFDHVYQGQFICYKTKIPKMTNAIPPKILLEPNL